VGEAGGGAVGWGEGKMSQSERENANGQAVLLCYSEHEIVSIFEFLAPLITTPMDAGDTHIKKNKQT
jgi:hypothetical protein